MNRSDERILPVELRDRLARHLRADETLVWVAQPDPHHNKMQRELTGPLATMLVIFSILFIFLIDSRGTHINGERLMVWAGGLVGLTSAVLILAVPKIIVARNRSLIYALTNKRALIVRTQKAGDDIVQSLTGGSMPRISRHEEPDGSGDLYLSTMEVPIDGNDVTARRKVGFMGIAKVREVETLIRLTLKDVPR